jgi:hypothetical protein
VKLSFVRSLSESRAYSRAASNDGQLSSHHGIGPRIAHELVDRTAPREDFSFLPCAPAEVAPHRRYEERDDQSAEYQRKRRPGPARPALSAI